MNVKIRSWYTEDIPELARLANNEKVSACLLDRFPFPYTEEEARRWISFQRTSKEGHDLVIEADGQFAGGIGIRPKADVYRKTVDIGYWLGEPYWSKGIATEAVKQFLAYISEKFQPVRIVGEIFADNKASMRVLEKNGFHLEGIQQKAIFKRGKFQDAHIWVKIILPPGHHE